MNRITHGERVIDPTTGLTKRDLVRYYGDVAERMLPHLRGRALSLVRAPDGVSGEQFFQRHDERHSIAGVRHLDPALWPGHPALLEIRDATALVQAAQMNVIEFHTWNSRVKTIARPDRVVFDLDPGDGVDAARLRDGATRVRELLERLGLRAWLKTSGGKGLHVVVPIAARHADAAAKDFARAVVVELARNAPSQFVARSGGAHRAGRIFVDYLRNGVGATTVAAYSARARPGLGVSMPIRWDELPTLSGGAAWNIANARERIADRADDPWADCGTAKQSLAAAIKRLGYLDDDDDGARANGG